MTVLLQTVRQVAAAVTAATGTLAAGKHNPVDATAAPASYALPTGINPGASLSVSKIDATANTITVTGSIRGVTNNSLVITWQHEAVDLVADSSGSWWPIAGRITKSSLDETYPLIQRITTATAATQARPSTDPNVTVWWIGSDASNPPVYALSNDVWDHP